MGVSCFAKVPKTKSKGLEDSFCEDKETSMTSRHGSLASVAFQKTMQDLIKGMRSNKENTSEFISLCISEIKQELTSTDPFTKAEAVCAWFAIVHVRKKQLHCFYQQILTSFF
jgi:hypothetical protein